MEDEKVVDQTTEDYIEAINKLKSNTVDKSEYEKLREDNRKLLDSIVNGSSLEKEPEAPKLRDPQEIRKELFNGDQSLSNLDFAKKSLELDFRGSSNQRIINVQESLKQHKVVLMEGYK